MRTHVVVKFYYVMSSMYGQTVIYWAPFKICIFLHNFINPGTHNAFVYVNASFTISCRKIPLIRCSSGGNFNRKTKRINKLNRRKNFD